MPDRKDQNTPESGGKSPFGKIKLVTFNLQNRAGESWDRRRVRLKGIARLLQAQAPDFVCLQECLLDDYNFLRENLGDPDSGFTPRDDGHRLGEGNPVFSLSSRWEMRRFQTFWLSKTPEVPSRSWRSAHHRIASAMSLHPTGEQSGILHVVNLHLDHRSALARRRSLDLIRAELRQWITSPLDAVLVCGDFNVGPQRLRRTGFLGQDLDLQDRPPLVFKDAAERTTPDSKAATFRGFGKFGFFQGRIDYCLYSTNLTCTDYAVLDPVLKEQWLSDHRLVTATFA